MITSKRKELRLPLSKVGKGGLELWQAQSYSSNLDNTVAAKRMGRNGPVGDSIDLPKPRGYHIPALAHLILVKSDGSEFLYPLNEIRHGEVYDLVTWDIEIPKDAHATENPSNSWDRKDPNKVNLWPRFPLVVDYSEMSIKYHWLILSSSGRVVSIGPQQSLDVDNSVC